MRLWSSKVPKDVVDLVCWVSDQNMKKYKTGKRKEKERERAKDGFHDTSEIFPGNMAQVETWDCPSAK